MDTQLLHEHHAVPRHVGGGDQQTNLIWLCPSCHDLLHRSANKVLSGKQGIAFDLIGQYLPTQPAARERLIGLVKLAAKAMKDYSFEDEDEDGEDLVVMQLHLPRRLHSLLKTLAGDQGIGLYRYTTAVLDKHTKLANDPYVTTAAKFGGTDDERPTIEPISLIRGPHGVTSSDHSSHHTRNDG